MSVSVRAESRYNPEYRILCIQARKNLSPVRINIFDWNMHDDKVKLHIAT
jgi:hypothetical protein